MSEKFRHQSSGKINYVALGVGIGMVIGAGAGARLGNVDFVMALGVLLGAALGSLFNRRN